MSSSSSLSAAGHRLLLRLLLVSEFKGAAVRQGIRCREFLLSLHLEANSGDDVLHIILLIQRLLATLLSAHAFLWRILGGCLKEDHAVGFGKAHCPLLAHLAVSLFGVTEVALIAHQESERRRGNERSQRVWSKLNKHFAHRELMQVPGYVLAEGVLPAFFYPGSHSAKAGRTGDIINEEHRVDVTVVVLHHGFTKALLSGCVPQLELMLRRGSKKGKKVRG